MRKTDNNVGDDKENMLRRMRAIAQADNEMKFESAVMDLKVKHGKGMKNFAITLTEAGCWKKKFVCHDVLRVYI